MSLADPIPSASGLLEKYWDGYLPVKVALIAERQGISLYEKVNLDCSGKISMVSDDSVVIELSASESDERKRFTIAHELGHYNLGHVKSKGTCLRDTSNEYSGSSPIEIDANKFAAMLLMPANAIQYVIEGRKAKTVGDMAKIFGVSNSAMNYRLRSLGYSIG